MIYTLVQWLRFYLGYMTWYLLELSICLTSSCSSMELLEDPVKCHLWCHSRSGTQPTRDGPFRDFLVSDESAS